jgi:hypothetical protein
MLVFYFRWVHQQPGIDATPSSYWQVKGHWDACPASFAGQSGKISAAQ